MNHINNLLQLNKNNWQKICTAEDWSKPEFQYVLKNIFKNNASYHRKQWEFITIFLCLTQQGKLHKNSVGASFGAGKEPLIYRLLPFVKSFHATDLYSWSTGWDTAKMGKQDTPMDFLTRNAPEGVDLDKLMASEMDMRKLKGIEDNSLDFCYSSCAIEHIGHRDDFISHLKEVKRVLKEDGVYVVTTEFLFNAQTIANKGNYKFNIEYLRDLFTELGLDSLSLFDAGCEESRLNIPRPFFRPLKGGKQMEKTLASAAILDIEGVKYTSCCFVLAPSKGNNVSTFKVKGLEQSAAFVKRKGRNTLKNMFSSPRELDPFYSLNKKSRLYLDDHMQFRSMDDMSPPTLKLNNKNFCFTDYLFFGNNKAAFTINYDISNYTGKVNWLLVEKTPMQLRGKTKIQSKVINHKNLNGSTKVTFDFQAKPEKVYAVIGQVQSKLLVLKSLDFAIDHIYVSAQLN